MRPGHTLGELLITAAVALSHLYAYVRGQMCHCRTFSFPMTYAAHHMVQYGGLYTGGPAEHLADYLQTALVRVNAGL